MKAVSILPLAATSVLCQVSLNAQQWVLTTAPVIGWRDTVISADGTRAAAAANNGPVYVSTNSTATWQATGLASVSVLGCSADGRFLFAAGAHMFISTNWGATWEKTSAPAKSYKSIACSGDGTKIVAATYIDGFASTGELYASTNSGVDWSKLSAPMNEPFRAIASSADGSQIVAVTRGEYIAAMGRIYKSADYGATWMPANAEWRPWASICSSASGRVLAGIATDGRSLSCDSGVTWVDTDASYLGTPDVTCSADGTRFALVAEGIPVQTSLDSGATWSGADAPASNWQAVASSADGCALVATVKTGGIYTWRTTPQPALSVKRIGGNLTVSWPTPSALFVLQQAPSLSQPEWTDVSAQPTLNYTNLNQEVSLPEPSGPMFYRLVSR